MIVGMGDNATLVIAITAADLAHLQSGQVGTEHAETLAYEGATPLGLVQNVILLYAADREQLIKIFTDAGVDASSRTIHDWKGKVRRDERTDRPKKPS
jgi:hypothetical protein